MLLPERPDIHFHVEWNEAGSRYDVLRKGTHTGKSSPQKKAAIALASDAARAEMAQSGLVVIVTSMTEGAFLQEWPDRLAPVETKKRWSLLRRY